MKKSTLGILLIVLLFACQKQVDYQPQINTLNSNITALQKSRDSLAAVLAQTNNNLNTTNNNIAALSKSLDSIKVQLTSIGTQIATLNSQMALANSNIATLTTQIAALNQQYIDLLAKYNAIISQLIPSTLNSGLVAYYPFNGNANDSSGNGNNGIVQGATLTTDRNNKANSAYNFNGSSSYIDIPNSFFNNGRNEYSVSIWVNPTSDIPSSGPGQTILNTNPHRGLGLGYSYNGSKKLYFFNQIDPTSNGNWDIADDKFNYVIVLNNWINITIIKRGVTFTYYVNGNIDKSTPLIQNPSSTLVSMRIGAITCCTPEYFNGKIDDIRFYNRALSDSEITYLATH